MVALTSALPDSWVRTRAFYSVSFCHRKADGSTGVCANAGKFKSHVKSGAMSHAQLWTGDRRRLGDRVVFLLHCICRLVAQTGSSRRCNNLVANGMIADMLAALRPYRCGATGEWSRLKKWLIFGPEAPQQWKSMLAKVPENECARARDYLCLACRRAEPGRL